MRQRSGYNRVVFLGVLILVLLVFVPTSLALGVRSGGRVVIETDEVIDDDLYVGAEDFTLNGVVKGDLFVGGGTITINGTVEGDLWAAGQWVTINGVVGDDARVAAGVVELGARADVGDDLMVAAYSCEARSESRVGGTYAFGGAQALLAGDIAEDVYVGSSGLELRGRIGGNVRAEVGVEEDLPAPGTMRFWSDMPPIPIVRGGLTLHEDAEIGGSLEYHTARAIRIPSGVVMGTVSHIPEIRETTSGRDLGRSLAFYWFWRQVRRFIALVIVALLLAWRAPKWITLPADRLKAQPGPSLGWGALIWFAVPVAFIVAAILIGLITVLLAAVTLGELAGWFLLLSIAVLLVLFVAYGLATTYLAKVLVAHWVGSAILLSTKLEDRARLIWSTLLGLVILSLIRAIPCLGALASIVVSMFGLGALFLWARACGCLGKLVGSKPVETTELVGDTMSQTEGGEE